MQCVFSGLQCMRTHIQASGSFPWSLSWSWLHNIADVDLGSLFDDELNFLQPNDRSWKVPFFLSCFVSLSFLAFYLAPAFEENEYRM